MTIQILLDRFLFELAIVFFHPLILPRVFSLEKLNHLIKLILLLFMLSFSVAVFGQKQNEEKSQSDIKFEVVSQRWLTKEEQNNSTSLNIAVRVRLSNNSSKDIHFISFDDGNIYPLGFHYTRKIGDKEWIKLSPDNLFTGLGYQDLILSTGMSIEYDFASMSLEKVEQKFSIVLSLEKGGKRFEIFTNIFRPITKE